MDAVEVAGGATVDGVEILPHDHVFVAGQDFFAAFSDGVEPKEQPSVQVMTLETA